MFRADAYERGVQFTARLDKFERPLYLMAHHDDEIATAGLLQRLSPRARVVWVTNSDGLYFESQLSPPEYGLVRKQEGINSVAIASIPEANTSCLDFSEVEIYRWMSELHSGKSTIEDARPFFDTIRKGVREAIFTIKPDAVFTLAWQGGQPEHDLTHFFGRLAVDDLKRETGEPVEFFHCPAYEYTILVAVRFHPLYKGTRIRLRLTEQELNKKRKMIEAYPSQVRLFNDFQKVFRWIVKPVGYLTGGPKTAEEFMAVEEFGPVPENLDYLAKPHLHDFFTYMFDDFEGVPVTFSRSVRPIVRAFL
ncbi:MAG: PIG-L family deacetylase [Deltaproteobacteria bacterium]|nr:PIG-L family deacetylase [Deltaproteobacteria bacterium]MBW1873348.1 PIG-L family deacetylase [Deltaproteobacteria bacterium]